MIHLDEVRPQYRKGGNIVKPKKYNRPNNAARNNYDKNYKSYVSSVPHQTINGKTIKTSKFEEWPSYLAFSESSYNPNASNKHGYEGFYALKNMKGKPDNIQHNALFKHVDKGVKSLTKEDLSRARKLGWNDAEILTKMHLFPMGVADYVWANYDSKDDNGTKVSVYGNGMPAIDVLDDVVTKNSIQGDYYILKPGESIGSIAPTVRIEGQRPSQNIPYLINVNGNKYNNRRKMSLKGEKNKSKRKLDEKQIDKVNDILFKAGDTIYFRK